MTELPTPAGRRAAEAAAAGAALAAAAFLVRGYDFGGNGYHAQFLPRLLSLLDPDLYVGDGYVAALNLLPTPFWDLLAGVCRWSGASPEAVCAAGFALASWATWSVVYLLARTLAGSRSGAWLGCGLALLNPYLNAHSLLASDTFLRRHLDATSFCLPAALAGLWAWLSGWPVAAGAV